MTTRLRDARVLLYSHDTFGLGHLRRCRATGLQAAKYYGWTVIACAKDGKMRSIDDIHNEIFLRVQECLKEN